MPVILPDTFRQDMYELQVGLKHSGHDPGPLDGFPGSKTTAAAEAMFREGSKTGSGWAIFEIEEALRDTGWLEKDEVDYAWSEATQIALGNLIRAKFTPRAAFVPKGQETTPAVNLNKPPLRLAAENGHRIMQDATGRAVYGICIHTSATPGDWWKGKSLEHIRAEFDRWHRARNFKMIGYHRIYHPDGSWIQGRPDTMQGAHVADWNDDTIGICMVPIKTISRKGVRTDFYTPEQIAGVEAGIQWYAERTPITHLIGHNEKANKLCPGFDVIDREWTELAVA